jgi:hypothetical protein
MTATRYIDPERFTRPEAAAAADTDDLTLALERARKTYRSCGGHKLAARMETVIHTITAELTLRGL